MLLERAVREQPKLRFTGTRRLIVRLGPEARETVERVWQDSGRSRVEFEGTSTDSGQIIVIANGQRSHYFPNSNEIQIRPARIEEPMIRLGEIVRGGRGGQIRESAGGAIAGIRTTQLSFVDASGNVLGKLWVDPNSAMVLKRELFDPSGRLVGSMEYLTVNSKPSFSENDFKIIRRGAKVVTVDEMLRRLSQQVGVRPLRLLESETTFMLEGVRPLSLGDGRKALLQSYFSKSGRRLTLYVTRGELDARRLRGLQGPNLATVKRTIGELTVVLIGNMPQADLDRLADQVR